MFSSVLALEPYIFINNWKLFLTAPPDRAMSSYTDLHSFYFLSGSAVCWCNTSFQQRWTEVKVQICNAQHPSVVRSMGSCGPWLIGWMCVGLLGWRHSTCECMLIECHLYVYYYCRYFFSDCLLQSLHWQEYRFASYGHVC